MGRDVIPPKAGVMGTPMRVAFLKKQLLELIPKWSRHSLEQGDGRGMGRMRVGWGGSAVWKEEGGLL